MRRILVLFGLTAGLALAACGDEPGAQRADFVHLDPTEVTPAEAITVQEGSATGVVEYFAALAWLSEPSLGPDAVVRDNFASLVHLDENNEVAGGRNDGRTQWWSPWFLTTDDPLYDLANPTTQTHPVINYDYTCADGRTAFVSHYVHEQEDFRRSWARDDFLGDPDHDRSTNRATLHSIDPDDSATNFGYLRPTNVGGPFGGAEYVLAIGPEGENPQAGALRYGFYQYFSFVDVQGVEVEVQITAPSFDFPDGWLDIDDAAPSVLDGDPNPFDLLDHERVLSRFDCGRELANRLAPVVSALDTSR